MIVPCPRQIVWFDPALAFGIAFKTMFAVVILAQPFMSTPTTVYVPFEGGVAVTIAPVVLLNPAEGNQPYVKAPDAVSVVDAPIQIEVLPLTVIGEGILTVTVAKPVLVQPLLLLTTTVYVVLEVGFAVMEEPVVELNPEPGDHE